jgi:hypothetical protein
MRHPESSRKGSRDDGSEAREVRGRAAQEQDGVPASERVQDEGLPELRVTFNCKLLRDYRLPQSRNMRNEEHALPLRQRLMQHAHRGGMLDPIDRGFGYRLLPAPCSLLPAPCSLPEGSPKRAL